MAGRGPAPKDPSKRARTNKDPVPLRVVEPHVAVQPELPSFTIQVTVDNEVVTQEFEWPVMTCQWWHELQFLPTADEFTENDWSFLLDTARLHAAYWQGDLKQASELRLREAKYGFTPEDRARLRIQYAQASESEDRVIERRQSSRARARGVSSKG